MRLSTCLTAPGASVHPNGSRQDVGGASQAPGSYCAPWHIVTLANEDCENRAVDGFCATAELSDVHPRDSHFVEHGRFAAVRLEARENTPDTRPHEGLPETLVTGLQRRTALPTVDHTCAS